MTMTEEKRQFLARLIEITDVLGYPQRGRQTMLAQHYKVTQGACRKWFAGEAMPAYEIQRDLCVRAHYNYEWLTTGRGEKKFNDVLYYESNTKLSDIMHVAEKLSEYKKTLALNIIQSLAETPDIADIEAINAQALEIEAIDKQVSATHPMPVSAKPHPRLTK